MRACSSSGKKRLPVEADGWRSIHWSVNSAKNSLTALPWAAVVLVVPAGTGVALPGAGVDWHAATERASADASGNKRRRVWAGMVLATSTIVDDTRG